MMRNMLVLTLPLAVGATCAWGADPAPPKTLGDVGEAAARQPDVRPDEPIDWRHGDYGYVKKDIVPIKRPDKFIPRKPLPKIDDVNLRPGVLATGRLEVKFKDGVRARSSAFDQGLISQAGEDLSDVQALLDILGMTIRPMFAQDAATLEDLQLRAELYSNRGQPDLQGMMYVTKPGGVTAEDARALNALDVFEFVAFEQTPVELGSTPCVVQGELMHVASELTCMKVGGMLMGPMVPQCGDPMAGDCYDSLNGSPYCDDLTCCETVGNIMPHCNDEEGDQPFWPGRDNPGVWDSLCHYLALQVCGGGAANICGISFNECFEESPVGVPGCNQSVCCGDVCTIDSFCCDVVWDLNCAQLAVETCSGGAIATGNYTPNQGYLTTNSYWADNMGIPVGINATLPIDDTFSAPEEVPFPGWQGQGHDLAGIDGVGADLAELLGLSAAEDYSRGKTIKVGVIEGEALVNHEDLDVTPEEGQTQIIFGPPQVAAGHGTACLGIIGARDDGDAGSDDETGMIGMAPDVDLYFFPTLSVEQGSRLPNAILSALTVFEPGDVLSYSIGFPPLPISSSPTISVLLRAGSDVGVTMCLAAGNSSTNIDNGAQFGEVDTGAIIVGACFPGRDDFQMHAFGVGPNGNTYNRLPFSNFCETCEGANVVHVAAWGEAVATLGYGDLALIDSDPDRSYTTTFNGTSAACPQIAALAARMQGISKMFFGIPLLPEQIRQVVSSAGISQGGTVQPGSGTNPFQGDWDLDSDDLNFIQQGAGGVAFPDGQAIAEAVYTTPWFTGNPYLIDVQVLTGAKLFGSIFSLAAADGNAYLVTAKNKPPGSNPDNPANAPGSGVFGGGGQNSIGQPTYVAGGPIADIQATMVAEEPFALTGAIEYATFTVPGFIGGVPVAFVEAYDWDNSNWVIQTAAVAPTAGPAPTLDVPVSFLPRYIRDSDAVLLVRVWTVTLGYGIGGNEPVTFVDYVNLTVDQAIGIGGGGGFGGGG